MQATSHEWSFPFAAHLGFRSADAPLFAHSARSADPLDQIEFAADLGFAGMQCVFATGYPVGIQNAIGAALRQRNLRAGCMLYASFQIVARPFPGSREATARFEFLSHITNAIEVAERIGCKQIAVLAAADPSRSLDEQREVLTERLSEVIELAQRRQVQLCLEALSSPVLPPMILQRLDQAVSVIEALKSPALRLIYDTAHVHTLEGDAIEPLERVFEHIGVIQLADVPGRFEPGSGRIDFDSFLNRVRRLGFTGLIELEHNWSMPGPEGEQTGLQRLRTLDDRLSLSALA